jgi:hypothetical protein
LQPLPPNWRSAPDASRAADFMLGTACCVVAAMPSFVVIALILRRGCGLAPALTAGSLVALGGYLVVLWLGRRFGLPV